MKRLAVGVLIALLLPAGAVARVRTVAPPGNSGIGQYLETIPAANGGQPTGTIRSGSGRSGRSGALSVSTERAFARQGTAGRSAAALANATAPVSAQGNHANGSTGGMTTTSAAGPNSSSPQTSGGQSPADSLAKALTGSSSGGGLGVLLPVILAVIVLGGGVLVMLRRRRTA